MRFFVLTIVIIALSLCGSAAKAQCFSGSCRLPGRPVERIARASIRLARAVPIGTRRARIQRGGWYFGKNFGRRDRGAWYPTKNLRRWR